MRFSICLTSPKANGSREKVVQIIHQKSMNSCKDMQAHLFFKFKQMD